jgi:hypothetical protein
LAYASTERDADAGAFDLTPSELHFFVTAETYEMFGQDPWNGFKAVHRATDIPPIYESPVPKVAWRQDFLVNGLIVIASFIASGIVGNFAYDLLKRTARNIWKRFPKQQQDFLKECARCSPYQGGDKFDKVFEACYIYQRRRLKGLELLSSRDGALFQLAKLFATGTTITLSRVMKATRCGKTDAQLLLRLLRAQYAKGERRWLLPAEKVDYYAGKTDQGPHAHKNSALIGFHTHGGGREAAWKLRIPEPHDFNDDDAMNYEVEVTQAATPDIEAYLADKITENELQRRVDIKAALILEATKKRMAKKKQRRKSNPSNKRVQVTPRKPRRT